MTEKLKKQPKMGRPPLPPGKKRGPSMAFRPTPGVRAKLEEAATANGRSMAQEVQTRLELSLAEDEAFGGSQFRALFGLLGKAANVIEQQTGESYFEDWYTGVAVKAAWKRLISSFGPKIPPKHIAAFERALAAPDPKFPMPPIAPSLPGLSQAAQDQYEQQRKDHDAAVVVYEEESAAWKKEGEALRRINETTLAQETLGKDVAVSLLPERPKKKA